MDREEVGYVAMPIAFASWIVGLILKLVLVAVVNAATTPTSPPPNVAATGAPATAPTGASPQPSTGPPPAPARQDVTARDTTISARIAERSPFVKTAMQWNERRPLRSRGQKQLFERLYESGADRMFVDMQGSGGLGGTLYIELPLNPAGRAACIDAYKNYCSDVRMEVDPREATDDGRRYLVIELKRM
jgi:hypothetical protein